MPLHLGERRSLFRRDHLAAELHGEGGRVAVEAGDQRHFHALVHLGGVKPDASKPEFFRPLREPAGLSRKSTDARTAGRAQVQPLAHATWLRMVAPTLHLEKSLPPAEFRTQDSRLVRQQKKREQEDDEAIRGISVLLAPDPTQPAAPVAATDRRQILDGIIEYGSSLVIAIENKIRSGIKTNQPSSINIGNAVVKLDEKVRTVAWQELLEAFADLSSRSLVTGGEQKILDVFSTSQNTTSHRSVLTPHFAAPRSQPRE